MAKNYCKFCGNELKLFQRQLEGSYLTLRGGADLSDNEATDIRASLAGDETAFGRLVDKYQQRVGQLMWRFSHDSNAHEELVQEVFVQAYLCLQNFAFKAPFEHWLCSIGTNLGYKFWKNQKQQRQRTVNFENFDLLADNEAAAGNDQRHTVADKLYEALEMLIPEDRLVLTLMYYEEVDGKEIAQRMGWSYTATRMRISRARKKLRALIEKHAPEVAAYAY